MAAPLLRSLSLAALEDLYASSELGAAPRGSYVGRFLCFVASPGARRIDARVLDTLMFRAVRFGVDFAHRRWWFGAPALRIGRFRVSEGPSRWRPATRTLRLEYDVSRLPRPVRGLLYDEVKPLADGRVLGLGGINREAGAGDHFFFALDPLS
jgi:hypothetical protein